MNTYKIDEKVVNEILTYLSNRPFNEVASIISRLTVIEKIVEQKEQQEHLKIVEKKDG
jgi:hypothetical protein